MFSESHPAFGPLILLRQQQCCKVRDHTGFDPRSLDQHSAKPPAWSPGSGSPGGILCVIDAVWGLVNWRNEPYSCADHMDMARRSVWIYLVVSRAGNDLWIFATFGGNLRQAQWHKQWAQNDGPVPATAEVFKPGISTWISFRRSWANFRPRLKAKVQGRWCHTLQENTVFLLAARSNTSNRRPYFFFFPFPTNQTAFIDREPGATLLLPIWLLFFLTWPSRSPTDVQSKWALNLPCSPSSAFSPRACRQTAAAMREGPSVFRLLPRARRLWQSQSLC